MNRNTQQFRKLKVDELNRLSVDEFKAQSKVPISLMLDNIRSLHNIGSLFRTADAFKLSHLYLCGFTATPPHREIRKTALGATESVSWSYHKDILSCIDEIKNERESNFIAVEQTENSVMLQDFKVDLTSETVLIFGNEVDGVQQDVIHCCDTVVEIPQFGTKHSLNISVSAGIVIWDLFKQYP